MKTFCKKLSLVALMLAVTAAPLCAQDADGTNTTDATNPAAPPPPAPPEPATPSVTNKAASTQKKHKDPGDHTPVRIDGTGIHVGGPDPVNIDFNMHTAGGFGKSGIPISAVIVGIVAIVTPFVALVILVACFFSFRQRRNRMLHETIRQMIDKGVPIPPELLAPPAKAAQHKVRSDLRNGLVMIGIGLGLATIRFHPGWILVFVGLAFLIIWYVEKKGSPDNNDSLIK